MGRVGVPAAGTLVARWGNSSGLMSRGLKCALHLHVAEEGEEAGK